MKSVRKARQLSAAACLCVAIGCGGSDHDGPHDQPQQNFDSGIPNTNTNHPDGATYGLDGALLPPPNQNTGDGSMPGMTDNSPFKVLGRLASAPGDKRLKGPGDAGVEHAVTHVMAVNPAAANPIRVLSALQPDGSFTLGIDLNTPWIIVLVDSTQVGANMVVGVFRAADFDLDSLAATRPGMVNLGDVVVDPATDTAHASVSTNDLLAALGLSTEAATLLGSMDDVSLRYVNPDIDGNGKIDVQEGVSYTLDFHLRYSMTDGSNPITFLQLLGHYADPTSTQATYGLGSAIAFWDPMRFGSTVASDYRVRFANSSGQFEAPPTSGSYVANEWIMDPSYFYTSAGTNSVGISFNQTEPFPEGSYEFEVKGTDLTFIDVRTHTLAELNSSDDLIIPFLKLNATDPTCADWSCTLTSFDYQWMRHAETGWVPATPEEVALLIPMQGGFLGFQPNGDATKRLEYIIPGVPVSGTIPFAGTNNIQGGVTPAEISALTVGGLCHVGISYDDTLGMRIFQNWQQNPACPN